MACDFVSVSIMSGPSGLALSAGPIAAGLAFSAAAWAAQTNFGRNYPALKRRRVDREEGEVTADLEEGELQPRRLDFSSKAYMNNQSHGIIKRSVRLGRREPYERKMKKIQKAAERAWVYAFRGINGMDSTTGNNKGWFSLYYGTPMPAGNPADLRKFPIDCFNLTGIDQQGTIATDLSIVPVAAGQYNFNVNVPFSLAIAADGSCTWALGPTAETNGPAETRNWSVEKVTNTDNPNTLTPPGQHAYLDWVRAQFMIYGKKKEESRVTVRLVQFTRDEFCPEWGYLEAPLSGSTDTKQRFDAVAQQFAKGLINNPIATKSNTTREPFFKELYKKVVVIPPKMTDDENDDPTKVQLEIFKRFNKLISYRDVQRAANGIPQENRGEMSVEQIIKPSELGYRSQPSRLRDNVYLLITAWDPREVSGVVLPSSDYQNSYDLNLRKRHTFELV